jgi:thiamine biosynthesis lipoprotein
MPMNRLDRLVVSFMVVSIVGMAQAAVVPQEFSFLHDHVLGTSLQVKVLADTEAHAQACEQAILKEIERLDSLLSTYESHTELGRVNATDQAVRCAPEVIEVLQAAEECRKLSDGAFNCHLGQLIELWTQAEKTGRLPNSAELAAIIEQVNKAAVEIDVKTGTVRRMDQTTLNVNAIAKGYIIDKALAKTAAVEGVQSVLLDIGGDIATVDRGPEPHPWTVGVANPRHSEDNAEPLVHIRLTHAGVATSGDYERYYTIAGKTYSHILDPKTGMPAQGVKSSSVVAPTCAQADGLATALSILPPDRGLALVQSLKGCECLLIDSDGKQYRSGGWAALETTPAQVAATASQPSAWAKDSQVQLIVTVGKSWWRPPLAIWIENDKGESVASLAAWGQTKYLKLLKNWWQAFARDGKAVEAISRATRPAGTYRLTWAGLDQNGKPVPQGTYTIRVEITPDGKKVFNFQQAVSCGAGPAKADIQGTKESKLEKLMIEYQTTSEAAR